MPGLSTYPTPKVDRHRHPLVRFACYATPSAQNQNGTCHLQLMALLMALTTDYGSLWQSLCPPNGSKPKKTRVRLLPVIGIGRACNSSTSITMLLACRCEDFVTLHLRWIPYPSGTARTAFFGRYCCFRHYFRTLLYST